MRTVTVLILVPMVLCVGQASAKGETPRQPTADEAAILDALQAYVLLCAIGNVDAPPARDGESFPGSLINEFARSIQSDCAEAMDTEVMVELAGDHERLTSLFALDADSELDITWKAQTLDITHPARDETTTRLDGSIDCFPPEFDLTPRETARMRKQCGVFRTQHHLDEDAITSCAQLTIDIVLAPPAISPNQGATESAQSFHQQRTLCFAKDSTWRIVSVLRGEQACRLPIQTTQVQAE